MSPELITAACTGAVAILGAIFTYLDRRRAHRVEVQGRQIADLTNRVGHLEAELERSKSLFREAVRFIRVQARHIAESAIAYRLGTTAPPAPEIPERLREEV
ncbi:hypothetical protein ACFXG4_05050 [Nocardia sp. NPDC059246]|uniref:hypothetical protein n=1 Tax=unclassified Nocardia TaxID=2637762 RepID=UPI0036C65F34